MNCFAQSYMEQLHLVVRILPAIARNGAFALKGGTAINLFERGLPRLSVGIDLCYPHFSERAEALGSIVEHLTSIRQDLSKRIHGIKFVNLGVESLEYKLLCRTPEALVKIEVNTTMRGHVFPIRTMPVHPDAEEILGQYTEMPVISREELYGGKSALRSTANTPAICSIWLRFYRVRGMASTGELSLVSSSAC